MFTKKNTARADCAVINNGHVKFYDTQHEPSIFTLVGGVWNESDFSRDKISNLPGYIELSRPKSDIDALFNDSPDWVTGYARLSGKICIGYEDLLVTRYWVGENKFKILNDELGNNKTLNYESLDENGSYAHGKDSFTIIATRPPLGQPVIESWDQEVDYTLDRPVYTKSMSDAGELPPVGSSFIDTELDDETPVLSMAHDLQLNRVVYRRGDDLINSEYFGAVASECKAVYNAFDHGVDDLTNYLDNEIHGKETFEIAIGIMNLIKDGDVTGTEYTGK